MAWRASSALCRSMRGTALGCCYKLHVNQCGHHYCCVSFKRSARRGATMDHTEPCEPGCTLQGLSNECLEAVLRRLETRHLLALSLVSKRFRDFIRASTTLATAVSYRNITQGGQQAAAAHLSSLAAWLQRRAGSVRSLAIQVECGGRECWPLAPNADALPCQLAAVLRAEGTLQQLALAWGYELPPSSLPPTLTYLSLRCTGLREAPAGLEELPSLQHLELDCTGIHDLSRCHAISSLTALTCLRLVSRRRRERRESSRDVVADLLPLAKPPPGLGQLTGLRRLDLTALDPANLPPPAQLLALSSLEELRLFVLPPALGSPEFRGLRVLATPARRQAGEWAAVEAAPWGLLGASLAVLQMQAPADGVLPQELLASTALRALHLFYAKASMVFTPGPYLGGLVSLTMPAWQFFQSGHWLLRSMARMRWLFLDTGLTPPQQVAAWVGGPALASLAAVPAQQGLVVYLVAKPGATHLWREADPWVRKLRERLRSNSCGRVCLMGAAAYEAALDAQGLEWLELLEA